MPHQGQRVELSVFSIGQALLATDGTARLFLDPAKVTNELPEWLGDAVQLLATERLAEALDGLSGQKVLVDPALSSAWYFDRLEQAGATVVRGADPCAAHFDFMIAACPAAGRHNEVLL